MSLDRQIKVRATQQTVDELEDATMLGNDDGSSIIRKLISRYRSQMIEKVKNGSRIKPWGKHLRDEEKRNEITLVLEEY